MRGETGTGLSSHSLSACSDNGRSAGAFTWEGGRRDGAVRVDDACGPAAANRGSGRQVAAAGGGRHATAGHRRRWAAGQSCWATDTQFSTGSGDSPPRRRDRDRHRAGFALPARFRRRTGSLHLLPPRPGPCAAHPRPHFASVAGARADRAGRSTRGTAILRLPPRGRRALHLRIAGGGESLRKSCARRWSAWRLCSPAATRFWSN
jgi:hypothetical protein